MYLYTLPIYDQQERRIGTLEVNARDWRHLEDKLNVYSDEHPDHIICPGDRDGTCEEIIEDVGTVVLD
jgi:hypothetical protein